MMTSLCPLASIQWSRTHLKYVELRRYHPLPGVGNRFAPDERYCLHLLDLRADSKDLLSSFHHNHVVRKIRRSEREKLLYKEGRSSLLLDSFYKLLVETRRRHGVPPQPYRWFRSILDCMPDRATVRVAFKDETPIASILTLRARETMVYKFGASDSRFYALGGMHFLLWRTIQHAREQGCVTLDLGRSEIRNVGLVAFKDHWGAKRFPLNYWRHPAPGRVAALAAAGVSFPRWVFTLVPDRLLIGAGRLLYRHIG